MGGFSLWHILILAVLVLLLFGGNRFSAMMGDVAKGLKSFKQGLSATTTSRPADPQAASAAAADRHHAASGRADRASAAAERRQSRR